VVVDRGKTVTLREAAAISQQLHAAGKRVVLTNGHFDLLHTGHVLYLEKAKQLGDVLFVGVNSDNITAKLKGAGRPIIPAAERALLLTCLRSVDFAIIFEDETADALIDAIRPNVYVKGRDYSPDSLPEADAATRIGAAIRFIPLVPHRSTTGLIELILSRYVG